MKLHLAHVAFFSAALAPLALAPGMALGQQSTRPAAQPVLEETLVSATRRTESLQEVPISISVLGAEDIVATGAVDLQELSTQVPNLVYAASVNQSIANISIRGIYSRVAPRDIGFDQSVGVYVDGVYHSRQFNANANMGDVERVEVLRGPQGTLFGRNTISGAINIISQKPVTDELQGKLFAEVGNRDLVHGRVSLNVPVIEDTLAIKIFGQYLEQDGYVDNLTTGNDNLGNQDKSGGRLQLRYTPGSRTTVDLSTLTYTSKSDDYFVEHVNGPSSDGKKYTTVNGFENTSKVDQSNSVATIEHEFDSGYTLTSITAYLDDEVEFEAGDSLETPIVNSLIGVTSEVFSQELRIASPRYDRYDFIAGLYYDDEESTSATGLQPAEAFPIPPLRGESATLRNTLDRESYAAFVHGNFNWTEQLTLFGGLRYTDETKKQKTHPATCSSDFTCQVFGDPSITETVEAPVDVTLDEWTWTAGLRFQLRDDLMLYGSVGTGVKSGAFNSTRNPFTDLANRNLVTDPEYVTSYELGMKSNLMQNRLTLNMAVFYMEYDDLQVRGGCTDCGPGGIPEQFLSNAASATSEGFELELLALPVENLTLSLGVGYNDSTYDEYPDVLDPRMNDTPTDASGNKVPLAPEWTINASAQYDMNLAGGTVSTRLWGSYIDERYGEEGVLNYDDDLIPDQTLLNASVAYRPAEDNWGVSVWVHNLTDDDTETLKIYLATFGANWNTVQYQEPRTYGLSVDYAF